MPEAAYFDAHRDRTLTLAAAVLMLGLLGVLSATFWLSLGPLPKLAAGTAVAFTLLLTVDSFFFTRYAIVENQLEIISQLRHFGFPLRSVRSVEPGGLRSLVPKRGRKRFASSRRCYVVRLEGERFRSIVVSPSDRDAFVSALLGALENERGARAAVSRPRR